MEGGVTVKRTFLYRESSEESAELSKALAMAQGKFSTVLKKDKGQYGAFASLARMIAATRPSLAENGLSVTQSYSHLEGQMLLVTELRHSSGQWMQSVLPVKEFPNVQQTYAYCTYMRRLAYGSILCLAAEDDDGQEASAGEGQMSTPPEKTPVVRMIEQAINTAPSLERCEELRRAVLAKVKSGEITADQSSGLQRALANRKRSFSRPAAKPEATDADA